VKRFAAAWVDHHADQSGTYCVAKLPSFAFLCWLVLAGSLVLSFWLDRIWQGHTKQHSVHFGTRWCLCWCPWEAPHRWILGNPSAYGARDWTGGTCWTTSLTWQPCLQHFATMFYIVLQPCWSCWPWKRCWILVFWTQILPGRSAAALRDYSVTTSQSTFSRMPGPHRALELAEQREINHWLRILRIQYDSIWFNDIQSIFQSDIEGFWMSWSLGNRKHVWNAPCPSITSLHGRSNGLLGCTCALAATWQDLARHEQMITDDNRYRYF